MSKRFPILFLAVTLLVLTAARLWIAAHLGLSPDEAYYRQWSLAPRLAYPDHPPAVAFAIRLGALLLGESALSIRVVGVILSAAAATGVYFISKSMGLRNANAVGSAILSTLLIAPASAAIIVTPDTLLGAFWILATLAAVRLRQVPGSRWWYVFAAAFAGGLWAKHTALLMPVLLLPALFEMRASGERIAVRRIILSAALFLALIAPQWAAEVNAGFPSLALQSAHLAGRLPGAGGAGPLILAVRVLELVSGQVGLLSPLIAVFMTIYLIKERGTAASVLRISVLLPMAAALVAGFFTHPEQNWAALGHPMAGPMVMAALNTRHGQVVQRRRRIAWTTAVFSSVVAVFAIVHVHCVFPILPLPPDRDPTSRLHGWAALCALEPQIQKADAVVCDNYGVAAELLWQLRQGKGRKVPVTSPDRSDLPPSGNWLLLEQENDYGHYRVPIACERVLPITSIRLLRPDGGEWDKVDVSIGNHCAPTSAERSGL